MALTPDTSHPKLGAGSFTTSGAEGDINVNKEIPTTSQSMAQFSPIAGVDGSSSPSVRDNADPRAGGRPQPKQRITEQIRAGTAVNSNPPYGS